MCWTLSFAVLATPSEMDLRGCLGSWRQNHFSQNSAKGHLAWRAKRVSSRAANGYIRQTLFLAAFCLILPDISPLFSLDSSWLASALPPSFPILLLAVRSPVCHLGRFDSSEEALSFARRCNDFVCAVRTRATALISVASVDPRTPTRTIASGFFLKDDILGRWHGSVAARILRSRYRFPPYIPHLGTPAVRPRHRVPTPSTVPGLQMYERLKAAYVVSTCGRFCGLFACPQLTILNSLGFAPPFPARSTSPS